MRRQADLERSTEQTDTRAGEPAAASDHAAREQRASMLRIAMARLGRGTPLVEVTTLADQLLAHLADGKSADRLREALRHLPDDTPIGDVLALADQLDAYVNKINRVPC